MLCSSGLVALAGCASDTPGAAPAATPAATPAVPAGETGPAVPGAGCAVTPIRTDRLPAGLDAGFSDPSAPPQWMGDDDFVAVLFYAGPGDPTMLTDGRAPNGANAKILWLVRNSSGPLTLRGTEQAKGAEFTQEIDGGGSYPSIVEVPGTGCWKLEASVSGRVAGTITLPVR
jgi:hypothetical protein